MTWKDDWETGLDVAAGVVRGMEAGMRIRWNRSEYEYPWFSSYIEELTITLECFASSEALSFALPDSSRITISERLHNIIGRVAPPGLVAGT
ncbi:MAG: hypothetical protein IPH59_15465 [bacterium]|nr:hypothetical protein [bacterium]